MRNKAQVIPNSKSLNFFDAGHNIFMQVAHVAPLYSVLEDANNMAILNMLKIKVNNHHSLRLKAKIALHINNDTHQHQLLSACSMCPPPVFDKSLLLQRFVGCG